MKNNQHILKSLALITMLVTGFVLFPFLGFSQQTEPVKRVSVVVTVREKTDAKEIVQLPADNLPTVISASNYHAKRIYKPKKTTEPVEPTYTARTVTKQPTKPVAAPTVAKNTLKPAPKKETTVATLKPVTNKTVLKPQPVTTRPVVTKPVPAPKTSPTTTATLKPTPKKEVPATTLKPEPKPVAENTTTTASVNSLKPNAGSLKPTNTTAATTTKKSNPTLSDQVKLVDKENDSLGNPNANNTNVQASNSDKQNTISYVWIGVVLIIAGIILGLLFGRTAFLVSFVGAIFILLGIFIF